MKFYAEIDYQNKIKPLYNKDYDVLKKVKKNEPLRFEVVRERNWKFHKKVMALLNIGFENQKELNEVKSFDHYRKLITMKAGFYEEVKTERGIVYFAESISFANMDQDKFEELFNIILDIIAKELDSEPEIIRAEVYSFM